MALAALALASPVAVPPATGAPQGPPPLRVSTVIDGLAVPWDLAFTPDGTMLVTERGGRTLARLPSGAVQTVATPQSDLFVGSESGLMGIATDPAFASNRRYYTCQAYRGSGTSPIDIRVIRWTLSADARSASRVGAPVVAGLPISSGRHGGCRLRFGRDGRLHVGTGDAAVGTTPQNLSSLGGKTLRVNTDGTAPADNPFVARGGPAAYVWTYGHRNVQGLALRPGTSEMWSAEHGPSRDDEVNLLSRGRNYGWDPVPGYNETVPMTDLAKFPQAVRARWSSGSPTTATSGAAFLTGSAWGAWEGALAVAELKNTGVRVLLMTPDGRIRASTQMAALNDTYGRIRTVQMGPDGSLYATTSNGSGDRVLRVTPSTSSVPYSRGLDVSPSGVSAVVRGTAVTVFGRGGDGGVYYTTQAGPGGAWSAWARIPGAAVGSAPAAVTWDGARIDVFARGTNGHLLHTWTTASGWARWQDRGGVISSAPAVASPGSGTIDVVARAGPSDSLYFRRFASGTWGSWRSVGGVVTSAAALHADAATGRSTATARGRSGVLYDIVLGPAGVTRGWAALGRHSASAPATSAGPSPRMVSRNGQVPVLFTRVAGTALGGDLSGAPAVAARSDGGYLVLGRGLDNALWAYDGRPGRHTWSRVGGALS